jgi:hypothetical protein
MKKELTPIEVLSTGNRGWSEGAYVLAFVYAKKGNFLLKGYIREVENYIARNYTHYFVNLSLWYNGRHRDIWKFWKDGVGIFKPSRKKSRHTLYKWRVKDYSTCDNQGNARELKFRRLPKRWIKEFEQF